METVKVGPRALPVVVIAGRRYYRDDRLREFRAVDNPHNRIAFAAAPPGGA